MLEVYCDGACWPNPGRGSWGFAIVSDGTVITHGYGVADGKTTNQRMEIQAAIEGLGATEVGALVTVKSDSQYMVKTMTLAWRRKVNVDLWDELDQLVTERGVQFEWVRGHAGHELQELSDWLAEVAQEARV